MSKKARPWSRQQRRAIRRRTAIAQHVAFRMQQYNKYREFQRKVVEAERAAVAIIVQRMAETP